LTAFRLRFAPRSRNTRRKWLLTGIKRTRRHEIRLLADTADEAIALAKNSYRFSSITDCVEDLPKQLPGGGVWIKVKIRKLPLPTQWDILTRLAASIGTRHID